MRWTRQFHGKLLRQAYPISCRASCQTWAKVGKPCDVKLRSVVYTKLNNYSLPLSGPAISWCSAAVHAHLTNVHVGFPFCLTLKRFQARNFQDDLWKAMVTFMIPQETLNFESSIIYGLELWWHICHKLWSRYTVESGTFLVISSVLKQIHYKISISDKLYFILRPVVGDAII